MMRLFCLQIMSQRSATQENGPVRLLACASLCINYVTGELTVPMEMMKPTPQLGATAVSFKRNNFEIHFMSDAKF